MWSFTMAWLPTFTYTDVLNNWDALLYQKGEVSHIDNYFTSSSWGWQVKESTAWMCSGNVMVIRLLGKFISCPKWQGFILWGARMYSMHSYLYVFPTISQFSQIGTLEKMSKGNETIIIHVSSSMTIRK